MTKRKAEGVDDLPEAPMTWGLEMCKIWQPKIFTDDVSIPQR